MDLGILLPTREECTYTKNYCEENVWKLCEHIKEKKSDFLDHVFVIFISNKNRTVPLWCQRAQAKDSSPVVWDYHVVLMVKMDKNAQVAAKYYIYDLDTYLPFPVSLEVYFKETFKPQVFLKSEFNQMLKVVSAIDYLLVFASDRSHMKKANGLWIANPPTYSCICTDVATMNLDDFISMESGIGTVYNVSEFMESFGIKC